MSTSHLPATPLVPQGALGVVAQIRPCVRLDSFGGRRSFACCVERFKRDLFGYLVSHPRKFWLFVLQVAKIWTWPKSSCPWSHCVLNRVARTFQWSTGKWRKGIFLGSSVQRSPSIQWSVLQISSWGCSILSARTSNSFISFSNTKIEQYGDLLKTCGQNKESLNDCLSNF